MNSSAARTELMENVASRWAGLGVMLSVIEPIEKSDVEQLLLDTARTCAMNSRLFTSAVTWLARFGDRVDANRLYDLATSTLEREFRPTLGLLLELADDARASTTFTRTIEWCAAAIDVSTARPLADVENESETLRRLSKSRASPQSLRWGRWIETFELKNRALRPVPRHPSLTNR